MTTCTKCNRSFPDHLVGPVAILVLGSGRVDYQKVCPMCGLDIGNQLSGSRRLNFSEGSHAQELLVEAREWLRREESQR